MTRSESFVETLVGQLIGDLGGNEPMSSSFRHLPTQLNMLVPLITKFGPKCQGVKAVARSYATVAPSGRKLPPEVEKLRMMRGLPQKKAIPGVKNIIAVAVGQFIIRRGRK